MNFFDHKDLGNHLRQLCPKVVKHPVYIYIYIYIWILIYRLYPYYEISCGFNAFLCGLMWSDIAIFVMYLS